MEFIDEEQIGQEIAQRMKKIVAEFKSGKRVAAPYLAQTVDSKNQLILRRIGKIGDARIEAMQKELGLI